jgi:hypothetical protein
MVNCLSLNLNLSLTVHFFFISHIYNMSAYFEHVQSAKKHTSEVQEDGFGPFSSLNYGEESQGMITLPSSQTSYHVPA